MNFRISWRCTGCPRTSQLGPVPAVIPILDLFRFVLLTHDENNSQCTHKHIVLHTNPYREVPHGA